MQKALPYYGRSRCPNHSYLKKHPALALDTICVCAFRATMVIFDDTIRILQPDSMLKFEH